MVPIKRLRSLFLTVVVSGMFSLGAGPVYAQTKGDVCTLGKPAKLFKRAQGKKFSVKFRTGDVVTLLKEERKRWLVERADGRKGYLNTKRMKKVCTFSQPATPPSEDVESAPPPSTQEDDAPKPKAPPAAAPETLSPPADSAPDVAPESAKDSQEPSVSKPTPDAGSDASSPSQPQPKQSAPSDAPRDSVSLADSAEPGDSVDASTNSDKAAQTVQPSVVADEGKAVLVQESALSDSATASPKVAPPQDAPADDASVVAEAPSSKEGILAEQAFQPRVSLPTYLSAAIGAVAFGVAGYYGLHMRRSVDEAKAYDIGSHRAAADAEAYSYNANIAIGVGSVALSAAIYFLFDSFLTDPTPAADESAITPAITGSVVPSMSSDGRPSLHLQGGLEW